MVDVAQKPEGLRERRRREVRYRILNAARVLLAERDVDSVRADEIAEKAQISRATFFNYYPSKAALLTDLGGTIANQLESLSRRALENYEDLDGALRYVFLDGARRIRQDEQLSRQLIDHLTRTTSDTDERRRLLDRAHRAYRSLFEKANENGELNASIDLEFLSELATSTVNGFLINWFNDASYPLEERLKAAVDAILRASLASS